MPKSDKQVFLPNMGLSAHFPQIWSFQHVYSVMGKQMAVLPKGDKHLVLYPNVINIF